MDGERIEHAVKRIESALARIAHSADTIKPAPPSVSALVVDHEELRETVANSLKQLDELIGELDR
ncbi:MAG: hypothetical protein ABJM58_05325 [Alteripontixanthobacter sp.]